MASRRKSITSMMNYRPTYFSKYKQPKFTLVESGADGQVSLQGLQALEAADAIVYDNTINLAVLQFINQQVPLFNLSHPALGAKPDQKQIKDIVVDLAFIHGHVVRLLNTELAAEQGMAELSHAEHFNIVTDIITEDAVTSEVTAKAL